jgi:subtilisin family serine protease
MAAFAAAALFALAGLAAIPMQQALAGETATGGSHADAKLAGAGNAVARVLAGRSARARVIVMFGDAVPKVDQRLGARAADAAAASIVAARQDAIITDVWGQAAARGAKTAPASLKRFTFTPGFAVSASARELAALARHPAVTRIVEDTLDRPALSASLNRIQMPQAWAAGATGAAAGGNRSVAVIDTGVRETHEFMRQSGRFIAAQAACFNSTDVGFAAVSRCRTRSGNTLTTVEEVVGAGAAKDCDLSNAQSSPPVTNPPKDNMFGCGHGTLLAGIAAGFNVQPGAGEPTSGVARNGRIVAVNVFSRVTSTAVCGGAAFSRPDGCLMAFSSDQVQGLEHVYKNRSTLKLASVVMAVASARTPFTVACDDDPRTAVINRLRDAGIATVLPAGNNGYRTGVARPGCISSAITVAATSKTGPLAVQARSNWGSLVDLSAPGVNIKGPHSTGDSDYQTVTGTSVAAAHVAGAIAALRSVRPNATLANIVKGLNDKGARLTVNGVTRSDIRVNAAISGIPAN